MSKLAQRKESANLGDHLKDGEINNMISDEVEDFNKLKKKNARLRDIIEKGRNSVSVNMPINFRDLEAIRSIAEAEPVQQ